MLALPATTPATAAANRACTSRLEHPALPMTTRMTSRLNPFVAIARAFDATIAAPASAALKHLHESAHKAALAADPEYARLEALRRIPGSDHTVLVNDKTGLDINSWQYQMDVRARYARHPWWTPLAYAAVDRPAMHVVNAVRHAWQRVTRGWDDALVFNFDSTVTLTLADQLDELADQAVGWPPLEEYPTFEDWQAAIRATAANLRAYTDENLPEGERADKAAAAFTWIARHLPHLWV